MATSSSQSELREKDTEEEIMDTAVETGEDASAENGGEREKKDVTSSEQEENTFKKPALFAAPSFAVRRGAVPSINKHVTEKEPCDVKEEPLKPQSSSGGAATPDTPRGDVTEDILENKTPETAQEEETCSDEEERVGAPPVETRQEVKPRVLPAIGKFKPHPSLPYTEPLWGGVTTDIPYALEILKNGTIVDKVPLTQRSYFVVGRLPVCDVALEHPSISRYHAVIQYRGQQAGEEESVGGEEVGFYIHDLGSTHGTFVNKNKVPPKTYTRLRVGHVLKFGGSTRLFVLQGPEFDEEAESDLTVTELRERARKQRAELEKRMMGEGSDGDDEEEKEGEEKSDNRKKTSEDSGCSWGLAEEAAPEEDENEENPFATEFQEDQEAAYLKDPKKALQGFYDREGEELELEYEDQNHGTWLCRIKLPVDDALGRQLVAEVTHTGKKKDAAIQCSLEACRILEARGLLRQEAVSRKRKKKNWKDEDYYDSDDDTFLDRTGAVEKKRQERMKKAGKVDERPDTYDSLVAKLAKVEKDLAETQKKLCVGGKDNSGSSSEDPLDAFMTAVRSEAAVDGVERRKLHVHVADLRKEAQRLRRLVELARPAQLPSLQSRSDGETSDAQKPKKTLPLFGAMKGGSKFKLKTGTIGKVPPKRPNLPAALFNMKELPPGGEEEEDEEEVEKDVENNNNNNNNKGDSSTEPHHQSSGSPSQQSSSSSERHREQPAPSPKTKDSKEVAEEEPAAQNSSKKSVKKKAIGPSRPPVPFSKEYAEDDPDYCVWVPPTDQTGDGRTHLNDKYSY